MKQVPKIKVEEVMTPQVRTIDQLASVRKAIEQMKQFGVGSLIVDRKDEDDEFGMITISDIAKHIVSKNLSFDRVNVYEVMKKPILTVHPSMDIRYAINIINRFKISRAAVLDGNHQLIGIISLRDIVLQYAED